MAGLINSGDANAYPMVEVTYYTMPVLVSSDCPRALQIALFLIWSIQSSTATSAMTFLGYVPLPKDMQMTAIETLTTLRCGTASSSQLVFDSLQADELALEIVCFIVGAIFVLMTGIVTWKRNHPSIRQLSFPVMVFLCLGSAGNVFSVVLYMGRPTQSTCNAIPWVKILELVTVYSVFMVRVKHWLRIKDADDELSVDDHDEESSAPATSSSEAVPATVEMTSSSAETKAKAPIAAIASSGVSSHDGTEMSESMKNVWWFVICFGVLLVWLIIPIVWTSVEPPLMQQRQCQGALKGTFLLIYLAFNLLLIAATTAFAYATNELDHVVHPIFIMVRALGNCSFTAAFSNEYYLYLLCSRISIALFFLSLALSAFRLGSVRANVVSNRQRPISSARADCVGAAAGGRYSVGHAAGGGSDCGTGYVGLVALHARGGVGAYRAAEGREHVPSSVDCSAEQAQSQFWCNRKGCCPGLSSALFELHSFMLFIL